MVEQALGYLRELGEDPSGDPMLQVQLAAGYRKVADMLLQALACIAVFESGLFCIADAQQRPAHAVVADGHQALQRRVARLALLQLLRQHGGLAKRRQRLVCVLYGRPKLGHQVFAAGGVMRSEVQQGLAFVGQALQSRFEPLRGLLSAQAPNEVQFKIDLARSSADLTRALLTQGDLASSMTAGRAAVALFEALPAGARAENSVRYKQGAVYYWLGQALERQVPQLPPGTATRTDLATACDCYRRGLPILQEIHERFGLSGHPDDLHPDKLRDALKRCRPATRA